MAGDAETGVTIHRTSQELDAGPIAAQQAFASSRTTMRAPSSRVPPRSRRELLDDVLPQPSFAPQPAEGATYAEKIAPADRELDLVASRRGAREPRARAVTAHRRAGG